MARGKFEKLRAEFCGGAGCARWWLLALALVTLPLVVNAQGPASYPFYNLGCGSTSTVISHVDGNVIRLNGVVETTLQAGTATTFSGLSNGDKVEGSGPLSVYAPSVSNRFQVWVSEMYRARLFTLPTNRNDPQTLWVYALCDNMTDTTLTTVSITRGGTPMASGSQSCGEASSYSVNNAGRSLEVITSRDVIVFAYANGVDARPVPPASRLVTGVASTNAYLVTSDPSDSVYGEVYNTAGVYSNNFRIRYGDDTARVSGARQYEGGGYLAYVQDSNSPIGAMSFADADGSESSPFLPWHLLATEYVVPSAAEFVSVLAVDPQHEEGMPYTAGLPEEADWQLVYDLDIPLSTDGNWTSADRVGYSTQDTTLPTCRSNQWRGAYKLQLDDDWVWVSFELPTTFVSDPTLMGVPVGSVQQAQLAVSDVIVRHSSNATAKYSLGSPAEKYRVSGSLEFWSDCYVEGLNGVFDHSDTPLGADNCYGSMQVHTSTQEIFSLNGWASNGTLDVGIGTGPTVQDWTYTRNAGSFASRRLQAFVACMRSVEVTVDTLGSVTTLTLTRSFHDPNQFIPLEGRIPTLGDGNVVQGTKLSSNTPMWALFEGLTSDDETIMFGYGREAHAIRIKDNVGDLVVPEGGSVTYEFTLFGPPMANVTVNITTNASDVLLDPSTVLFTPDNWATAAVVTVSAVDDTVDEPRYTPAELWHSLESMDPGYSSIMAPILRSAVVEDDEDKPGPPSFLPDQFYVTGGKVHVVWAPPSFLGSDLLRGYILEYRLDGESAYAEGFRSEENDTRTEVDVGGLQPSTRYYFRIAAFNRVGASPFTAEQQAFTSAPTAPGPSDSLYLLEATGGSLRVGWDAPIDTGGISLDGYVLYMDGAQIAPPPGSPPSVLVEDNFYKVTGLEPSTAHTFAVAAVNVLSFCVGNGDLSPNATFSTLRPTPPGPPSDVAASSITGGAFALNWDTPSDTGGLPVTGYVVDLRPLSVAARDPDAVLLDDGFQRAADQRGNNVTSSALYRLEPSTAYQARVRALSFVDYADTALYATGRAPSAPVSVSWNTAVYPDLGLSAAQGVAASTAARLSPALTLELWLTDLRANSSALVLVDLADQVPETGRQQAVRLWFDADRVLRLSITRDGATEQLVAEAASPMPHQSWVHVAATHSGVGGVAQLYIDGNLVGSGPLAAPRNASWAHAALLTVPESGGEPFMGYADHVRVWGAARSEAQLRETLMRRLQGNETRLVATWGLDEPSLLNATSAPASHSWLPDLDAALGWALQDNAESPFQTGSFGLRESDRGLGDPSAVLNVTTTAVTVPSAPQPPTLVVARGGTLWVAWQEPLDIGGAPLTSTEVQRNTGSGGTPSVLALSGLAFAGNVTGLQHSTTYKLRVRFQNSAGWGPYSATVDLTTTAPTLPSAPAVPALRVFSCDAAGTGVVLPPCNPSATAIAVQWALPDDTGGTTIDRYVLTQQVQGVGSPQVVLNASATTFDAVPVSASTTYEFRVAAVNSAGQGAYSVALPVTTPAISKPDAPAGLIGTGRTGGSLTMAWDVPTNPGGSITGYRLFKLPLPSTDPAACATPAAGTDCELVYDGQGNSARITTVKGLLAATEYTFRVLALNAASGGVAGTLSEPQVNATSNATLPEAPAAPTLVNETLTSVAVRWDAPADTGGVQPAELTYRLYMQNSSSNASELVFAGYQFEYEQLSLLSGDTYRFYVSAVNQLGEGPRSPAFTITLREASAPDPPVRECVAGTYVTTSWTAPVLVRGVTYLTTVLYLGDGAGANLNKVYEGPVGVLFTQLLGLTPDTDYTLFRAVTNITDGVTGEGPISLPTSFRTSSSDDLTVCESASGVVDTGQYTNSAVREWRLTPPAGTFDFLRIDFTRFDVECDHDQVEVRYLDDGALLWSGGCHRQGFTLAAEAPAQADAPGRNLSIVLTSDASVVQSGLRFAFTAVASGSPPSSLVPCPAPLGRQCSGNSLSCGTDGACTCDTGWTGEDCSARVFCPSPDPLGACSRLASTLIVSPTRGNDTQGTGSPGSPTQVNGTVGKPFATLGAALAAARPGDLILAYPGLYNTSSDCSLSFANKSVVLSTTALGSSDEEARLDCNSAQRAFSFSGGDESTVVGLTVVNTAASAGAVAHVSASSHPRLNSTTIRHAAATATGGAFVVADASSSLALSGCTVDGATSSGTGGLAAIVGGTLSVMDSVLTSSSAGGNGGAFHATGGATVTLDRSTLQGGASGASGGLAWLDGSTLQLIHSSIRAGLASANGGGLAIAGSSTVTGTGIARVANSSAAGEGGAVYVGAGASLALSALEVAGSNATNGGGVAVAAGGSVTAVSLSVAQCTSSANGGAASLAAGASLQCTSCTVQHNAAGANGGALALADATTTFSGGDMRENSAQQSGGAVTLAGGSASLVLSAGVSVTLNTAAAAGGAVHASSGAWVAVRGGSTVASNQAGTNGGGVAVVGSRLVVHEAAILRENHATACGGAVYASAAAEVNITDMATMVDNIGVNGGGLCAEHSTVVLASSLVSGGTASGLGGGVHLGAGSVLSANNATLRGSSAADGGGCVSVRGASRASIRHSLLSGCSVTDTAGGEGGCISAAEGSTLSATDVTFEGCSAGSGGAVAVAGASTATLDRVALEGNLAVGSGGAAACTGSNLTMLRVSCAVNRAGGSGGCAFASQSCSLVVAASNATHNMAGSASTARGGGLALETSSVADVMDVMFLNNSAAAGGAVSGAQGARLAMQRAHMVENRATLLGGGAVYIREESWVNLTDVVADDNMAATDGGAMTVLLGSTANVTGSTLRRNVAENGGGVRVQDASRMRMYGSHILVNQASGGSGGGLSAVGLGTVCEVSECRLAGNSASQSGGAVSVESESGALLDGLSCEDNVASSYGGCVWVDDAASCTADVLTVRRNSAQYGGGLAVTGSSSLTVSNTVVANHSLATSSAGGGLYAASSGLVVHSSQCSGNTAGTGGCAAVTSSSTASLVGLSATGCKASSGNGGGGAVAVMGSARVVAQGGTVLDANEATAGDGGALFVTGAGSWMSTDASVSLRQNRALHRGGGAYVASSGTLVLTGSMVADNVAGRGGAFGVDSGGWLDVRDLSITGHSTQVQPLDSLADGAGGTVWASGAVLNVTRVTVSDSSGAQGGCMWLDSTAANMQDVTLGACSASTVGGGVLASGASSVSLLRTSIVGGAAGTDGGCLYATESTLVRVGVATLFRCTANGRGGGGFLDAASLEGSVANVSECTAGTRGGGLFLQSGGTLDLESLTLVHNEAQTSGGGGIAALTGSSVALVSSDVSSNLAAVGNGGEMLLQDQVTAVLTLCTLRGRGTSVTAANYGGGLFLSESTVTLRNSTVSAHRATADGGGVYVGSSSSIAVDGGAVDGNRGESGGGFFVLSGGTLALGNGTRVSGNRAVFDGGGIYLDKSVAEVTDAQFASNEAGASGGAAYLDTGSSGTFRGTTFGSNSAGTSGGGVFVGRGSTPSLLECAFERNDAGVSGGGLYAQLNTISIGAGTRFVANTAADGGGMYLQDSRASLSSLVMEGNVAEQRGGAIAVSGQSGTEEASLSGRVTLVGCVVRGGSASEGGAIAAFGAATLELERSVVEGSESTGDGAGVHCADSASFRCLSSNITGNVAAAAGGGVYMDGESSLNLTRCVLESNVAVTQGGGAYLGSTMCAGEATALSGTVNMTLGSAVAVTSADLRGSLSAGELLIVEGQRFGVVSVGAASVTLTSAWARSSVSGRVAQRSVPSYCMFVDGLRSSGNRALEGAGLYWSFASLFAAEVQALQCTDCSFVGDRCQGDARNAVEGLVTSACPSSGSCTSVDGVRTFYFGQKGTNLEACRAACEAQSGCSAYALFTSDTSRGSAFVGQCYGRSEVLPVFTSEAGVRSGVTRTCGISTNGVRLRPGWLPTGSVESGRPLRRNGPNSGDTSDVHVLVDDFYGHQAITDTSSRCAFWRSCGSSAYFDQDSGECVDRSTGVGVPDPEAGAGAAPLVFLFGGGTAVSEGGLLYLPDLRVRADVDRTYSTQLNCTVGPNAEFNATTFSFSLSIAACAAGFQLSGERVCEYCSDGFYSLDGRACLPCPFQLPSDTDSGANCTRYVEFGGQNLKVGTTEPVLMPGFWRDAAEANKLSGECDSAIKAQWDNEVCAPGTALEEGTCRELDWTAERIYRCLTGLSFYRCPFGDDACSGNSSQPCKTGYTDLLCGTCSDGYYQSADETCRECQGGADKGAVRAFYVTAFVIALVLLALLVALYLSEDGVYKLRTCIAYVNYGTRRCLCFLCERRRRAQGRTGDATTHFELPDREKEGSLWFRPEKWKILIAFFQVFSTFRESYDIYWPTRVEDLMRQLSVANLDFIKVVQLDCLIRTNYYNAALVVTLVPVAMVLILFLLFEVGRCMYNRRMARYPRRCLHSGLRTPMAATQQVVQECRAEMDRAVARARKSKANTAGWRNVVALYGDQGRAGTVRRHTAAAMLLKTYSLYHPDYRDSSKIPAAKRLTAEQKREVLRHNAQTWKRRVIVKLQWLRFRNRCLKLFFWVLLLTYVSVSNRVLRLYNCRQIGDTWYLARDLRLECFDSEWYLYAMLGVPVIIFYVMGVPFLFGLMLWRARNEGVNANWRNVAQKRSRVVLALSQARDDCKMHRIPWTDPVTDQEEERIVKSLLRRKNMRRYHTIERLGFIYQSYTEPAWWYEVWDFVRKLIATAVIALLEKGMMQLILGMMFMLASSMICLHIKPYKDPSDTLLANVCLLQLFLVLFSGFLLEVDVAFVDTAGDRTNAERELVQWFIVVTMVIVVCSGLLSIVYEKVLHDYMARQRNLANQEEYERAQLWNTADALLQTMKDPGAGAGGGAAGAGGAGSPAAGRRLTASTSGSRRGGRGPANRRVSTLRGEGASRIARRFSPGGTGVGARAAHGGQLLFNAARRQRGGGDLFAAMVSDAQAAAAPSKGRRSGSRSGSPAARRPSGSPHPTTGGHARKTRVRDLGAFKGGSQVPSASPAGRSSGPGLPPLPGAGPARGASSLLQGSMMSRSGDALATAAGPPRPLMASASPTGASRASGGPALGKGGTSGSRVTDLQSQVAAQSASGSLTALGPTLRRGAAAGGEGGK